MEYRKFKATYLFTGDKLLDGSFVLVTDRGGTVVEIVEENQAGSDLELLEGILSPGFINAHCHIELSHLRGRIPRHTGLAEFVCKVVAERHFAAEEILESIAAAEAALLTGGTVAVGDICNNDLTILQKTAGKLYYHNFIEVSGWRPDVAAVRLEKCRGILEEFLKKNLTASLVPHAPYSVSPGLWGKIAPFFTHNVVSIHNQETPGENELFLQGTGSLVEMYRRMQIDNSFFQPPALRSVATYFKYFARAASVILVHNTFITQEDLDYIRREQSPGQLVSFCLCPNANQYIEDTLPPVELLLKNGCGIVIGTDSLASNDQLSVLDEIKTLSRNFPFISTGELLQWATSSGARALQVADRLGNFSPGTTPGLVLIENAEGGSIGDRATSRRIL